MKIANGAILNILDIDLDFFLNYKHTSNVSRGRRLDGDFYKPWSEAATRSFLEKNCGLSTARRMPGTYCVEHVEVFHHWRKWQESHNFSLRFVVDHVDAHADLGTGDASYSYISGEILHLAMKERAYPKEGGWYHLLSGNYLAFAVACRWIERLRYINDEDWIDDCQWFHLKDFASEADIIQMKRYSKEQMARLTTGRDGPISEAAPLTKPLELEPEVLFEKIDFRKFRAKHTYDFIFLAQSPMYTPESSDALIPVIQEYMDIS